MIFVGLVKEFRRIYVMGYISIIIYFFIRGFRRLDIKGIGSRRICLIGIWFILVCMWIFVTLDIIIIVIILLGSCLSLLWDNLFSSTYLRDHFSK